MRNLRRNQYPSTEHWKLEGRTNVSAVSGCYTFFQTSPSVTRAVILDTSWGSFFIFFIFFAHLKKKKKKSAFKRYNLKRIRARKRVRNQLLSATFRSFQLTSIQTCLSRCFLNQPFRARSGVQDRHKLEGRKTRTVIPAAMKDNQQLASIIYYRWIMTSPQEPKLDNKHWSQTRLLRAWE